MTSNIRGSNPVWNEILTFDIQNGQETLTLTVENRQSGEVLGTRKIPLKDLSEGAEIDQMTKDKKYTLQQSNGRETDTEIRVKLHWIYSKVNLLEDLRE